MISRRTALGLIGSGISTFAIGRASAADYPARPVRWIVRKIGAGDQVER